MDLLGDSQEFPEHWLFKHRWGKGKKNQPSVLPNGEKIIFLTVGGRTSAVVPSVQKKTGAVSKDVSDGDGDVGQPKRKRGTKKENSESGSENEKPKARKSGSEKQSKDDSEKNGVKVTEESEAMPAGKRRSTRNKK